MFVQPVDGNIITSAVKVADVMNLQFYFTFFYILLVLLVKNR